MQDYVSYSCFCGMEIEMSRHVFRKGMAYFRKNGFKKAVKRTIYFFTEKRSYEKLLAYTNPTPEELNRQREEKFIHEPKVSILIPMYNTPLQFFKELIDCVQAQTYSNWELCLADGTGSVSEAGEYAVQCMAKDSRIVYKMLDSNDGISENTNRALEMATGEFIALMDHDDVITPDALYHLVKAVNEDAMADSVYSDEDKMDMDGRKLFEPHFKPDFNIDYLRSCNYICHMFMTRTSIAREVGGFRKPFDGAQDFDFIFRCTEKSRHVAHVPRVIYHWRCHVNSTAAVPESKMYAYHAGVKSINEHCQRAGIPMTGELGTSYGYYRDVPVLDRKPSVDIIIHGDAAKAEQCMQCTKKLTYGNLSVMMCGGDAASVNRAVASAAADYVLLLDSRITSLSGDLVEQLMGYVQRKDVAMAAARTSNLEDKIYHAFLVMGIDKSFGYAFHRLDKGNNGYFMRINAPQDVSGVDITCTLIRRADYMAAGQLDESMPAEYAAADLCLKVAQLNDEGSRDSQADEGEDAKTPQMWRDMHKIVYVPYAEAVINASVEPEWHIDEEDEKFNKKWSSVLRQTDRYYNRNLTKRDTNFTILSSMELKNEDL